MEKKKVLSGALDLHSTLSQEDVETKIMVPVD